MSIDYDLHVIDAANKNTTVHQFRECLADAIENLKLRIEALEALERVQEPKQRPQQFRLIKDLPTFKKGDIFEIGEDGCLWHHNKDNSTKHYKEWVMAYHKKTLEAFPNIMTDWFEEEE